jgi:hypothetical protein
MTEASPEVLSKLAELIKATGDDGAPHALIFKYLKGIAELFNAIAWPTAIAVCAFLFRSQMVGFIKNIDKIKFPFGIEVSQRITSELKQSADEAFATTGLSSAPSEGELIRAKEIEKIAVGADIETIELQAEELAAEYERVRHAMSPGDSRTRRMEVVVSKMRTLARAFFPLRHDFASSSSPGKRLMVIAALQVDPDYDMLGWLAERLPVERPFVGYHAVVALLLAARAPKAADNLAAIEAAVEKAESARGSLPKGSDRVRTLDDVERVLAGLKQQAAG